MLYETEKTRFLFRICNKEEHFIKPRRTSSTSNYPLIINNDFYMMGTLVVKGLSNNRKKGFSDVFSDHCSFKGR